ncbi:MAG: MBL fold metallo-hydrolase [Bacteroidetes bacterium]|nr:MAG: MBL fold metallo-hydrolase [Bacteroidota bacterium]
MRSKHFGGKLTPALLAQYEQSDNWRDGKFQNLEDTRMDISLYKIPGLICEQLNGRKERVPARPLPVAAFDRSGFEAPSGQAKFIWYGHSVVLMRLNGQTILVDPMLGPDASPIAPVSTKRFSNDTLDLIDDLPEIDLLLLTHDHYDHLDYASMQKLKRKTRRYFVALGVRRHLVHWGVDPDLITEFDWWDQQVLHDITITFTPTRHFAGRGLSDRARSLWGGWAFRTPAENIWFSGDGGYGKHFREIGKRLGPFDFAFMECGQYNELWHQIHLFPEESIQAALDAQVKKVMPVHWGGFTLAPHHWTDPAERFLAETVRLDLPLHLPQLGRMFQATDQGANRWWLD